ncbi:MAG TPA: ATP-binding protein [Caldisericia bacterium]|nr:ATP-binding protein [Caldisericia bacterium]
MDLSKTNGKNYAITVSQDYAKELWHFREYLNHNKKIALNIDVKKNFILKITPFDLDRIILNIIKNSVEAIKEKGSIKIALDTVKAAYIYCNACNKEIIGEYGICCIENSGEPIKNINDIFKKHYTTKNDGRGLGLYIVDFLLHLSDGHITVENTNPGVCFKMYIPIK